jgi:hypothetical protein
MQKTVVVLCVVMMASVGAGLAQESVSHPGYYPIEAMDLLAPNEIAVNVDLEGALLQAAAGAMQQEGEDADIAQLVTGLERVRLLVGSPKTADAAAIAASFEGAVSVMEGKGWKRILSVVDEGERVLLFAREDGGSIAGLTLLVNDGGEELVLVNVVGAIDPVLLGRVIAKADQLPQLESYLSAGQ